MEKSFFWKALLSGVFFIFMVVIGCNVAAQRLEEITGQEIQPFFYAEMNNSHVFLEVMGENYQLSIPTAEGDRGEFKEYIQSSWSKVQLTVAPRIGYVGDIWLLGLEQLKQDLTRLLSGNQ